jgi:hypothetical protein
MTTPPTAAVLNSKMAADLLSQGLSVELARFIRENALVLDCTEHGLVCEYLALDTKQLLCAECLSSLDEGVEIRNIIIVQTDGEQELDQPLVEQPQADKPEPKLEEDKMPEGRARDADAEADIDFIQELTDGWNCTHCTLLNPLTRRICSACFYSRADVKAEETAQPRRPSPEIAQKPRSDLRARRYDEVEDDKQAKALHEDQESQRSDEPELNVLHSNQFYSSKEIEESGCLEWQCSECTLHNKIDQYFCSACDSTFASLERYLSSPDQSYRSSAYQSRSPPKPKPTCQTCLKETSYETDKCIDCRVADIRRTDHRDLLGKSEMSKPTCKTCFKETSYETDKCLDCKYPGIRGTDHRGSLGRSEMWQCAGCTKFNAGSASVCYHCTELRDAVNLPEPERNRHRLYLEVCKRCSTPNTHDSSVCSKCYDSLRVSSVGDYQPRQILENCAFCRFANPKGSLTCEGCHHSLRASASQFRRTYHH